MPQPPDVAILCGGMGTRLRSVLGDRPKALAEIGGRPFLHRLVDQLIREGFRRIILCTGVGREAIRASFNLRSIQAELIFSEEAQPLGTGGAIRNCLPLIRTDEILVTNGDSYTDVPLEQVWNHSPNGLVRLVAVPSDDRHDAGTLHVNEHGRVTHFQEKSPDCRGRYLSAGIYLIPRNLLSALPQATVISMERDLLPRWIQDPGIQAVLHSGKVIDIGTPARLEDSQLQLAGLFQEGPLLS